MKLTLSILLAAVLFTANVYATDSHQESGEGTFTAAVLSNAFLDIMTPGGPYQAPPDNPDEPYSVNLGYFFPGSTQTVELGTLNKVIQWRITGPRIKPPGNNVIDYHCWSVNGNYFNSKFSVEAQWIIDTQNYQVQLGQGGGGNFDLPDVHLIEIGPGSPDGEAFFTVKAIRITVFGTAQPGDQIVIPITVYVSVNI